MLWIALIPFVEYCLCEKLALNLFAYGRSSFWADRPPALPNLLERHAQALFLPLGPSACLLGLVWRGAIKAMPLEFNLIRVLAKANANLA